MSKFKNITKKDLTIPDVGLVKSGEIKEMPDGFHNVNFEKIESQKNNLNTNSSLEEVNNKI